MCMLRSCLFAVSLVVGSAVSLFASVDQELLSMAPPEATFLTGIDVARTSASPFGQHILSSAGQEQDFQQLLNASGFDPRRDLQQLLLAGITNKATNGRFALLARGNFDVTKLSSSLQTHGFKPSSANGTTLLVGSGVNNTMALAFPHAGIAVMGDVATVREVLAGGSSTSPDPELLKEVSEVGPGNDVWFATLLSANILGNQLSTSPSSPQLFNPEILRSITHSSGGIQFGSTVSLAVHLVTRSEQDAQSVSDLLKFAGNLLQAKQGEDPRLNVIAAALSTMQLQQQGPRVDATFAVDERVLEHFIDQKTVLAQ